MDSRLHFALLLIGLGTVIGTVLLVTGAPIWAFYIAPLLTVPILIPALRVWDAHHLEQRSAEDPRRRRFPSPARSH
jgi:hypothetical protein